MKSRRDNFEVPLNERPMAADEPAVSLPAKMGESHKSSNKNT